MSPPENELLVNTLRKTTGSGENLSLPRELYVSETFHEIEIERIFLQEWHCVGRVLELTDQGDYLSFEIVNHSIFVVRSPTGLKAFLNICAHRSARLLEGRGQINRIICPYHAWTYDLDGQLTAAPFMGDNKLSSLGKLIQLHLEIWEGWIYVTLNANPKPLTPRITDLQDTLTNYRMALYEPLFRVEETWNTNWKSLVENFTEPYHLFQVHKKTVEPSLPTRMTEIQHGGKAYSLLNQHRIPGSSYEYDELLPTVNNQLTAQQQLMHPLTCIFPCHLIALSPDRLFWMSLQPIGPHKVRILWGADAFPGAIPKGLSGENRTQQLKSALNSINQEDKKVLEPLHQNLCTGRASVGILSPYERTLIDFNKYLARLICE